MTSNRPVRKGTGLLKLFLILFFQFSLFSCISIHAQQERIVLRDSTVIVGKVIGFKDDMYTIRTSYGELKIPGSDIESINKIKTDIQPEPDSLLVEVKPHEKVETKPPQTRENQIIYLPQKDFRRLNAKRILQCSYFLTSAAFVASWYINDMDRKSVLTSAIQNPTVPISTTAGQLLNFDKYTTTQNIFLYSTIGLMIIDFTLKNVKTGQNPTLTEIVAPCLYLGSIFYTGFAYGFNKKNINDNLEECIDAYQYNDNTQIEYANKAGEGLAKSSNILLMGTILFGSAFIIDTYNLLDINMRFKPKKKDLSLTLAIDPISNTILPTIQIRF